MTSAASHQAPRENNERGVRSPKSTTLSETDGAVITPSIGFVEVRPPRNLAFKTSFVQTQTTDLESLKSTTSLTLIPIKAADSPVPTEWQRCKRQGKQDQVDRIYDKMLKKDSYKFISGQQPLLYLNRSNEYLGNQRHINEKFITTTKTLSFNEVINVGKGSSTYRKIIDCGGERMSLQRYLNRRKIKLMSPELGAQRV
jgi:hypothetical protein